MKYLVVDTECSGATNGTNANPYSRDNKLCYLGVRDCDNRTRIYNLFFPKHIHGPTELLVLFNAKFDLAWLRRYNLSLGFPKSIFDCQLAHFIITGQKKPYPSLNEVAEYYGLGQKIDIIKEKYWNQGIDTDQIPEEEIKEYLEQDLILTQQIFLKQVEYLQDKPQLKKIVWWACQDELATLEMEYNGIKYDFEKNERVAERIRTNIKRIDGALCSLFPDVPINWNSGDHLSAILYGGSISFPIKETYIHTYKDGSTKEKTRNVSKIVEFTRLVTPLEKTELKQRGKVEKKVWSTSEPVLAKLKAIGKAKEIIKLVSERSLLETRLSRYYEGFPKLYKEMQWQNNIIHSNLNHCVAVSGRLSSTKPNIQNLEEEMRACVVTRFGN